MKSITLKLMMPLLALMLTGCFGGGQSSEEQTSDSGQDSENAEKSESGDNVADNPFAAMQQAAEQMEKALDEQGMKVEPVDFRDLKALLPEELIDLPRTASEGEKTGSMGIKVSTAKAKYESEDRDKRLDITISDLGTLSSGLGSMMAAAWLMTEVDKESDNGYEKTTKFEGYRAFEKFTNSNQSGQLSFVVGDRFIVEFKGRGLEMDALKEAANDIDLGELEDMKDFGKEQ